MAEMTRCSNANELSRDEWLGLMLDRELAMRADKLVRNRLASAKLRFPEACIEENRFCRTARARPTQLGNGPDDRYAHAAFPRGAGLASPVQAQGYGFASHGAPQ
ncbi:hypothetical protein [Mesorhizobium sp. M0933]|uniref:hypothetical protein n=1 Tax=Mesorhizobium sp. M0933 TaxID=2957030 RepID=UPI003334D84F